MSSVLVVDDNEMNLRLLNDVLKAQGYTVYTASSGREALERAHETAPDLVLLDVQMPGMSGTEVMQQLKADDAWRQVPILAVTALAMQGDETELIESGFNGYVSKPIALKEMLKTVRGFLEPPR